LALLKPRCADNKGESRMENEHNGTATVSPDVKPNEAANYFDPIFDRPPEGPNDEEVIARLRAERASWRLSPYEQGERDGERWARESVRERQFIRLELLAAERHPIRDRLANFAEHQGIGLGLFRLLFPDEQANWEIANAFWSDVTGEPDLIEDQNYAAGFFWGVVYLWRRLKPVM